jgi:hypothetical protein
MGSIVFCRIQRMYFDQPALCKSVLSDKRMSTGDNLLLVCQGWNLHLMSASFWYDVKSRHDVNIKLLSSYKCSTIQPFTTANPCYYRVVRHPYILVGVLHCLAVFVCMRVEHSPCVDASENVILQLILTYWQLYVCHNIVCWHALHFMSNMSECRKKHADEHRQDDKGKSSSQWYLCSIYIQSISERQYCILIISSNPRGALRCLDGYWCALYTCSKLRVRPHVQRAWQLPCADGSRFHLTR